MQRSDLAVPLAPAMSLARGKGDANTVGRVSVVIPTYNREESLCQTIDDMLGQDYDDFEVIVVDQTRKHVPEVADYLEKLPQRVRYITLDNANLPAARNVGIKHATGNVIIFIDDDIRAPVGFVRAHAENYRDPTVMAVAGAVLGAQGRFTSEWPNEARDRYLSHFHANWSYKDRIDVKHARGANHSFRRCVPEHVGMFDEHYVGPAMREEADFYFRVWKCGMRIVYDPNCWLEHFPPVQAGGCWAAHDGISSTLRFYNHAYFILKNLPRHQWIRMLMESLWSSFRRRETLRLGAGNLTKLGRFIAGWYRAFRRRPWINGA